MTFLEFNELIEALRIQKKVQQKQLEDPNYKKPVPKKINSDRELPDKIDGMKIIISGHTKEVRDSKGETEPRDYGFSDTDYKRVLLKFSGRIKNENLAYGKYTLFYKHKKTNNYDVLGVYYSNNKITVYTIIQQDKKPSKYKFSSDLSDSKRIILESGVLLELI